MLPEMRWKTAIDPPTAHTTHTKKTFGNVHFSPFNIIYLRGGCVELARQDDDLRIKMIVLRCTDA